MMYIVYVTNDYSIPANSTTSHLQHKEQDLSPELCVKILRRGFAVHH